MVAVQRHPRARHMRLRYDAAAGRLKLVIPRHASIGPARRWTQDQQAWISDQLDRQPARQTVSAGCNLPWRDGQLYIDWQTQRPRRPELIEDADGWRIVIGGPETNIGARVARWLKAQAAEELRHLTDIYAARAGLSHAGVSVGDPRSRWGSCSSNGRIRYSWRIAMAPDFVRTALVAHEVAHLAHMHHGPAFHALVDDLVGPMAAQSRAWLKAHGPSLHLLDFGAVG